MSDTTTILGGVPIDITLADGSKQSVTVRDLPMGVIPDYWKAVENEGRCVELFCDKPPGWADTLSRESWEAIVKLGEERNLDFLLRFSRRATERREKVMPGMETRIIEALARSLATSAPASAAS